jgi:hypothetical protein
MLRCCHKGMGKSGLGDGLLLTQQLVLMLLRGGMDTGCCHMLLECSWLNGSSYTMHMHSSRSRAVL